MHPIARVVPIVLVSAMLAAVLPAGRAAAQPIQRVPEVEPQQLMATQLSVLAHVGLQGEAEPRPTQLTVTRILLDEALKLDPNDSGLWRMKILLAESLDDPAAQLDAMKQYLRLVPDDEPMQLRMVTAMLGREELLDRRLENVTRLLNAQSAKRLSKPLRSRLAAMAAAMALELGENQQYYQWLQQATRLDPVNPQAARMTYELAVQRSASSRQLGAAAIQLLRAEPLDFQVRIDLAAILLSEGLYEHAVTQFKLGLEMDPDLSQPDQVEMYVRAMMGSGQRDRALSAIQLYQQLMTRYQYQAELEAASENAPEGEPPPQPDMQLELAELPPQLELLRLAILTGAQRPGAASSDRAAGSFAAVKRDLLARAAEGDEQAGIDYLWVGAVFGHDLDAIRAKAQTMPENEAMTRRVLGWLAIQAGDTEDARQWLTPIGTYDPLAAYGLAVLDYDRPPAQVRGYQLLASSYGYGLSGAMAASRLHEMGEPVRPSQTGGSLERLLETVPNTLWELDLENNPWLDIRMEVPPGRFSFLQPMSAVISVKNLTTFPMPVGAGATVPTTCLVQFSPTVGGQAVGRPGPLVVDMNRRLTLQAGEVLMAEVRLDQSALGDTLRSQPFGTVSMNGTAIFDPRQLIRGGITTGPLGGTYTVRAVQAVGEPVLGTYFQSWNTALHGGDTAEQMLALARMVSLVAMLPGEAEMQQPQPVNRDVVARSVNDVFPELDPMLQAWTVRFLPPTETVKVSLGRVIDIVQRSDDPLIRIMYLSTQVSDPADPSLLDAMRSDVPVIREFATARQTEIEVYLEKQAELEALRAEQEAAQQEQQQQQQQ